MKAINFILLLFILIVSISFSQEKKIVYDNKTDLRQIAKSEFGDPNLWPFILKYNNLNITSSPKNGTTLIIPTKKVNELLKKFKKAENSVNIAIEVGAKVLTEDLINSAILKLNNANKLKREFEIDKLDKLCDEIIYEAENAYKRTKEIREKTIDAILSYKVGTVQKLLSSSIKWNDIKILENLKENDLARTLSMSLAKITFYDLNQIKLNENSQAIIQHSKYDPLTKKGESKVKIEKGDAYAILSGSPKKKFDLEIKGVKTKINSKYFWVEKTNNGAKFSNYNGSIDISSKDSLVSIKRNEGTIVEENKPPLPAIKLLPAPTLIFPNDKEFFSTSTVLFSWTKIENAKSYWLEIAEDDSFKTLFTQIKNIDSTLIGIKNITDGIKYWRVCSLDINGLPGIYSEPKTFVVKTNSLLPQLIIFEPKDFTYTKENEILIKGKTEDNCVVSINSNNIIPVNNLFEYKYTLLNGFNKIDISSTNKSNKTKSVTINVYYENNPDIELFDGTVLIKNELMKKVNSEIFNLRLTTRPFSTIKLVNTQNNKEQITFSDSLGNFYFLVNISDAQENFKLVVNSKAGYSKEFKLTFIKDITPPKIYFSNTIPQYCNYDKIKIEGKVTDCKFLKINNDYVEFDKDGSFLFELLLKENDNEILFEFEDDASNNVKIIKNIFYDKNPPVYLSHKFNLIDSSTSSYEIVLLAKDDFEIVKTSIAEIYVGKELRKETLVYDSTSKAYKGKFLINNSAKPILKSILLKDIAGNEKLFQVNK